MVNNLIISNIAEITFLHGKFKNFHSFEYFTLFIAPTQQTRIIGAMLKMFVILFLLNMVCCSCELSRSPQLTFTSERKIRHAQFYQLQNIVLLLSDFFAQLDGVLGKAPAISQVTLIPHILAIKVVSHECIVVGYKTQMIPRFRGSKHTSPDAVVRPAYHSSAKRIRFVSLFYFRRR